VTTSELTAWDVARDLLQSIRKTPLDSSKVFEVMAVAEALLACRPVVDAVDWDATFDDLESLGERDDEVVERLSQSVKDYVKAKGGG
jgi:hypothetical protein